MKDTNQIEEYLITMPPAAADDLESFTDEAKGMYEPAESGGYRLKPSAKAAIEETNAEIQQLWDTYQTGLAERDAKIAHMDAELRRVTIKRDIENALVSCGIKTSYFRAASLLLEQSLNIEVTENDDGSVSTTALGPYGRTTVAAAVAHWLSSDEGQAFAPKRSTHEMGPLQSAMRKLKGMH